MTVALVLLLAFCLWRAVVAGPGLAVPGYLLLAAIAAIAAIALYFVA